MKLEKKPSPFFTNPTPKQDLHRSHSRAGWRQSQPQLFFSFEAQLTPYPRHLHLFISGVKSINFFMHLTWQSAQQAW